MSAKTSAEMKEAFKIFLKCGSVTEAAQQAGISRKALYKHQPYIDWKKSQSNSIKAR